ncbi:MAG: aminotransferase class I/II-fold pyridoxal phosphate-dependent enzyme [Phycisphaerae bacterium]
MSGEKFLAERITTIGSSGIRKVFDLAASMKNPIDLSMGQPDFAVPEPVKQAAIDAIRDDHNGYTVTHGLPALRERIARELGDKRQWSPEVIVTCGVSGGLVLALTACLNPQDEVIFADPYFVSYKYLVNLSGGRAVPVDIYGDFRLDRDAFAAAITPRTKMILLNSPANPTGVVHTADEIRPIAELAREHDLLLVTDEIYEMLSYDGAAASPVSFAPERTLLLGGFGKSYGMTGWRMGYAAGPSAVIREMAKLQQFTFVCAPHMAQIACIVAMDTDMSEQVGVYRRKRDLAVSELESSFEFATPSGGFYVFCKAPAGYASGTAFVEEAIRNNVLVVPGSAFSGKDTHFRISYAVPDERLKRGCEILRNLAR